MERDWAKTLVAMIPSLRVIRFGEFLDGEPNYIPPYIQSRDEVPHTVGVWLVDWSGDGETAIRLMEPSDMADYCDVFGASLTM